MLRSAPIEKTKIKQILIRGTNWVGDAVITLPALESVRQTFPDSNLTVLARPWVQAVYENHPAVDRVIPYPKGRNLGERLLLFHKTIKEIRSHSYDLAVLFQNAFEAGLLAYLAGIKYRVGFNTDGRGFLLTHAVRRNAELLKQHQVEYYLYILRSLGWEAHSRDPALFIAASDMEFVRELLASRNIHPHDFILGLSPGAMYGPAKRWPPERFAAIGDRAAAAWNAKVVIIGSSGEKRICETVRQNMRHPSLNLAGQTSLGQVMALIALCRFFVTNDSGLMHVAAALNRPMVAVFGSTDPGATGPRSSKARWVQHPLDCSPCFKPQCKRGFACMLGIEPDEVWEAMEKGREYS
ncbi:MAG: lipopolysaccharide heptosyltransferase II [Desulfobacteraceae bacterium]|nr:MAG: lipopolysaccharide heptosyltransferase II [Desulfobacteraceae bacterium]